MFTERGTSWLLHQVMYDSPRDVAAWETMSMWRWIFKWKLSYSSRTLFSYQMAFQFSRPRHRSRGYPRPCSIVTFCCTNSVDFSVADLHRFPTLPSQRNFGITETYWFQYNTGFPSFTWDFDHHVINFRHCHPTKGVFGTTAVVFPTARTPQRAAVMGLDYFLNEHESILEAGTLTN